MWQLLLLAVLPGLGVEAADNVQSWKPNAVFTSSWRMEMFFKEELEMNQHLLHLNQHEIKTELVTKRVAHYVSDLRTLLNGTTDPTFVHNPAYLFLRHVAVGWPEMVKLLAAEVKKRDGDISSSSEVMKTVLNRKDNGHIPSDVDGQGVVKALLMLLKFYSNRHSKYPTAEGFEEMFERVKTIMEIRHLLRSEFSAGTTSDAQYRANLARSERARKVQKRWDKRVEIGTPEIGLGGQMWWQHRQLCQGRELRPASVTSKLYCMYSKGGHQFYTIGPLKVEIVSLTPYITLTRGLILPEEPDQITSIAGLSLRMSETVDKTGKYLVDDTRLSEQTWIAEWQSPLLSQISNRIGMFFNLEAFSHNISSPNMSIPEPSGQIFQVANYGLGGHFAAHYDALLKDVPLDSPSHKETHLIHEGDRMATVMGFLSEVTLGGLTSFPYVGTYLKPEKGAVAVWWNMDWRGDYDRLVLHAGSQSSILYPWLPDPEGIQVDPQQVDPQ